MNSTTTERIQTLTAMLHGARGAERAALQAALDTIKGGATSGLPDLVYRQRHAQVTSGKLKSATVVDPAYPGLRLRMGPRSATWLYRADTAGKQVEHQIGGYPSTTVAQARDAYNVLKDRRIKGTLTARAADAPAMTLAELCKRFVEHQSLTKKSWRDDALYTRLLAERHPSVLATEITSDDIGNLLHELHTQRGPRSAGKAHACLRRMFRYATEKRLSDAGKASLLPAGHANPAAGFVLPERDPRKVPYSAALVGQFLLRLDEAAPAWLAALLRLQFLTCSRVSEIAELPFAEVTPRGIELPAVRAKNARAHVMPLSTQARAIIAARPAGEFVFEHVARRAGPASKQQVALALVEARAALDVGDITSHWLRHWALSLLKDMGAPLEVRDRLSNHASRSAIDSGYTGGATMDQTAQEWAQRLADRLDALQGAAA